MWNAGIVAVHIEVAAHAGREPDDVARSPIGQVMSAPWRASKARLTYLRVAEIATWLKAK